VTVLRGPRDALYRWQQALSRSYLPHAMTFAIDSAQADLPGVLNKPAAATVNAYLCRGVTCLSPTGDIGTLLANLEAKAA
jgi:hypothetical protein